MRNKIISLIILLAICIIGLSIQTAKTFAAIDPFEAACDAAAASGGELPSTCNVSNEDPISGKDKEGAIIKAIRLVALVAGIASIIVIILGGFQYVLSTGDHGGQGKPNRVNQAKNTILYAVIGLVIVIIAQAIVVFIVSRLNM